MLQPHSSDVDFLLLQRCGRPAPHLHISNIPQKAIPMLLVLPLLKAAATARSTAWPSILPTLLRLLLLLLLASALAWNASELLVQGVSAVAVISLGLSRCWGIFVGIEGIIIIVTGNILHTESRCRQRVTLCLAKHEPDMLMAQNLRQGCLRVLHTTTNTKGNTVTPAFTATCS